ncbi:MAG: GTPase domain-containing protein [Chloroflexi bacterium]|nr:GTPase domain-containing protein [Chloroflexota bacterium]
MSQNQAFFSLRDALRVLRSDLPGLRAAINGSPGSAEKPAMQPWFDKLKHVVLPSLDFNLPVLLVAISGGGSAGKSTLFNMLAGNVFSRVGFKAGLTKRVLLAGHPEVLSSAGVAQALLYRLHETPQPWHTADDLLTPGAPLYATSESVPKNLLLLDTPDFDTGEEGRLLNREKAEPVLRAADVILYVFTNTIYNNMSNTQFMADVVGGIGGRPVILVYRISRAASNAEVLEHCRVVANKLFHRPPTTEGFPEQIVGTYRMPESDAVALGREAPQVIPLAPMTAGRDLNRLLADLDISKLKRQIFDADLRAIRQDGLAELAQLRAEAQQAALYRSALQKAISEQALASLKTFPLNEAVSLATRLFIETGPNYIKLLRGTGRFFGAPFRLLVKLGQRLNELSNPPPKPAVKMDPEAVLSQDLQLSANTLRNRLMDDRLILRLTRRDELYHAAEHARRSLPDATAPLIEPSGEGTVNVHVSVPDAVQRQEGAMVDQDWEAITAMLRGTAHDLVGLPTDIEDELRALVIDFRSRMPWQEQLRETFFASLSALPPILGISYALLTVNPVAGTGLWIQLQGIFGLNDLWALVSIPVSAGLSSQERKQLEMTITPVFQLWLQRRMEMIINIFSRTVCKPVLDVLDRIPQPDDPRFERLEQAFHTLEARHES